MVRGSAGLSQPGVGAFSPTHRAATLNAGNLGWPQGGEHTGSQALFCFSQLISEAGGASQNPPTLLSSTSVVLGNAFHYQSGTSESSQTRACFVGVDFGS